MDSNDQDVVARRAYERFEQRGSEHGHDLDDWLEAEREVSGGNTPYEKGMADTRDEPPVTPHAIPRPGPDTEATPGERQPRASTPGRRENRRR